MEPIDNPNDVVIRPIVTAQGFLDAIDAVKEVRSKTTPETVEALIVMFGSGRLVAFAAHDVRGGGDGETCGMVACDSTGDHINLRLLSTDRTPEDKDIDLIAQQLLTAATNYAKQSGARGISLAVTGDIDPYMAGLFDWAGLRITHMVRALTFEETPAAEYPEDTSGLEDYEAYTLVSDADDNAPIQITRRDLNEMIDQRIGNLALPLCHDDHSGFRDKTGCPLSQVMLFDKVTGTIRAYAAVRAEYDDHEVAGARIQWFFTRPDLSSEAVKVFLSCVQHELGGRDEFKFIAQNMVHPHIVAQLNGAQVTIGGF